MKTVYTSITNKGKTTRLRGSLDADSCTVWVSVSNGPMVGGFLLSRFEGEKLTATTLNKLFQGLNQ